jgi:anti-sigma factor RsiW
MLSCQECERYIPVFLDHALEVKENLDVQAHLQSCFSCQDRAKSERRLRMFVRQFLDVPPPPEEIKRAIILRAMQDERRCGWWASWSIPMCLRDFAMGMATAAILALGVYGIFPDIWSDPDIQKVVRESSLAYGTYVEQHMPLEVVSADASAVTKWFNTHMGHHFKMPCLPYLRSEECRLDVPARWSGYRALRFPWGSYVTAYPAERYPERCAHTERLRTSCRYVATRWRSLFHGGRRAP